MKCKNAVKTWRFSANIGKKMSQKRFFCLCIVEGIHHAFFVWMISGIQTHHSSRIRNTVRISRPIGVF